MVYFIPTPIGNLDDISQRGLKLLCKCHTLFCEDTRVTKKLLSLLSEKHNLTFDIKNFIALHSHNEKYILDNIDISVFDETVAYLSDAGMPCVSDPGALLVKCCFDNDIVYDVLPGANALLTAYAMSGFNKKEFTFYGFLSHKPINRKAPLNDILNNQFLTILYESPHRILQLIQEINSIDKNRELFIVKELTKMYQTSYKGKCKDILNNFKNIDKRGEWVVIIDAKESLNKGTNISIEDINNLKLPPKQKAKLLAKMTGENIKDIYNTLI